MKFLKPLKSTTLPSHFCIVPFVHFSCKPDGSPRICCYSNDSYVRDEQGQKTKLGKNSLREIWHSGWMNRFRQKVLGEAPLTECRWCYTEEAAGKKSKRQNENEKYLEAHGETIRYAQGHEGQILQAPVYYDLRLGNLCNLKCRTCNPLSSSAWAKEVADHPDVLGDPEYQDTLEQARQSGDWHQSSLFWDHFHDVAADIEEIYFTGGEPMLIQEHFRLLQFLVDQGFSSRILLRYNTNLTKLPEECFLLFGHFKKVKLSCSIDAIGEKNNWMRSPSRWPMIVKNLEKAALLSSNVDLEVNCTVSIFNVLYFGELLHFFKDLSARLHRPLEVFTDILHEPVFMKMELLPEDLKNKAQERLRELETDPGLPASQKARLASLRRLLQTQNPRQELLLAELRHHIRALDGIRHENFAQVFPELSAGLGYSHQTSF